MHFLAGSEIAAVKKEIEAGGKSSLQLSLDQTQMHALACGKMVQ